MFVVYLILINDFLYRIFLFLLLLFLFRLVIVCLKFVVLFVAVFVFDCGVIFLISLKKRR